MNFVEILPSEKQFYVNNGPAIQSIDHLIKALENNEISDDALRFHTDRKDFSSWVSGVYEDEKLSKALVRIKTKKTLLKKLKEAVSMN